MYGTGLAISAGLTMLLVETLLPVGILGGSVLFGSLAALYIAVVRQCATAMPSQLTTFVHPVRHGGHTARCAGQTVIGLQH